MSYVVGQRVRVRCYETIGGNTAAAMGDPHCLVGHFGHIKQIVADGRWIDVEITHGPNGGPIDQRIIDANRHDQTDVWGMTVSEIEAVD